MVEIAPSTLHWGGNATLSSEFRPVRHRGMPTSWNSPEGHSGGARRRGVRLARRRSTNGRSPGASPRKTAADHLPFGIRSGSASSSLPAAWSIHRVPRKCVSGRGQPDACRYAEAVVAEISAGKARLGVRTGGGRRGSWRQVHRKSRSSRHRQARYGCQAPRRNGQCRADPVA